MDKTENSERGDAPAQPSDPAAWAALSAASRAKADAFLDEQKALALEQKQLVRLQAEELEHELKLRHWSLRVRHLSDVMKLAFEFAVAVLVLGIVAVCGSAVWAALHDDALVIDAFTVPPDMVAKGLTGQVVATQVQDHLSAMITGTDTVRLASSFHNAWDDDIKVEIPDTGVSVSQLYRYLAAWLGHQTHITGEVWRSSAGIVLSARAGDAAAQKFTGSENDLDALTTKAAEHIYCQTQPYRCAVYLIQLNRETQAERVLETLASNGPATEKPWAYTMWGTILGSDGQLRDGVEKERMAARLGPDLPNVAYNHASAEAFVGHDEEALAENIRARRLFLGPSADQLQAYAVAVQAHTSGALAADGQGDWQDAIAELRGLDSLQDYEAARETAPLLISADLAYDHDVTASARVQGAGSKSDTTILSVATLDSDFDLAPLPALMRALALDDWVAARNDIAAVNADPRARTPFVKQITPVWTAPWLAYVNAKLGDFHAAHVAIDATPLDCYLCARMRGNVSAAEKQWGAAAFWFAEAVRQGPSIPFAYADWGAMLLRKGDGDAAIAKFKDANAKGPHFADPLEMWGEALMLKNRSDLALAKFEEADKYAPNWGRLHLEWGEALFYAGNRDEAKKQFANAAALDLSPSERTALARFTR